MKKKEKMPEFMKKEYGRNYKQEIIDHLIMFATGFALTAIFLFLFALGL